MSRFILGLGLVAVAACEAPPSGSFDIACADDACTSARLSAAGDATDAVYRWLVDGTDVGVGATYVHEGVLGEPVEVTLQATNTQGTVSQRQWLIPNQLRMPDDDGTWTGIAYGFDRVESYAARGGGGLDQPRLSETECTDEIILTSIGGCFTGTNPFEAYISVPSSPLAPPAFNTSNYVPPATFTPGAAPVVQSGGWDGARAWLGGAPVEDAWVFGATTGPVPRFEAAFVPNLGDTHWIVTTSASGGVHERAIRVECGDGVRVVTDAAVDADDFAAFRAP